MGLLLVTASITCPSFLTGVSRRLEGIGGGEVAVVIQVAVAEI